MTPDELQEKCMLLLRALDYGLISEGFHNRKIDTLFNNTK